MSRKIIVCCGDVAGCSPWLALELLKARKDEESLLFVGPAALRGFLQDQLNEPIEPGIEWVESGKIDRSTIVCGELSEKTGSIAFQSFKKALSIYSDRFDGLITLPLSKKFVQLAGHENFIGHTETLEKKYDERAVMSFFGQTLNVSLLTRHIPLFQVPEQINLDLIIRTVRTVENFYQDFTFPDPSFALLGMNPHAGESGRIGKEDTKILTPAVEKLRNDGIDISGPEPADSFLPVLGNSVDHVFSCYHDQGLVAFKQKHFFDGIQATLGLPINRVSPDHGVAVDRAETGDIDPTSTLNCLEWLRGNINL